MVLYTKKAEGAFTDYGSCVFTSIFWEPMGKEGGVLFIVQAFS
jgi:hypothetical protein